MTMKTSTLCFFGATLAAVIAFQAAAQPAAPAPRAVTRDEFRACLATQDDLLAKRASIEKRNNEIKTEQEEITAESAQMELEAKRMIGETGSSPRAERFERRTRAHNLKVKALGEKSKSVNDEVTALNAATKGYNESCGNMLVKEEDREAVRKEREAAGKK